MKIKSCLCLILVLIMLMTVGCSDNKKGNTTPTNIIATDGTANDVGMEVLTVAECFDVLNANEALPAKNVILFIGDGMSQNEIEMTKILFKDECTVSPGVLAMESLPIKGQNETLCADSTNPEPDSASGGTALSCGYKSMRKYIGLDYKGNVVKNVTELAGENKKSTGIVTTESIVDATPATFTVHAKNRDDEKGLAHSQIVNCPADIIMGGGKAVYTEAVKDVYTDGVTYSEYMKSKNITWATDWSAVENYKKTENSRLIATLTDDYFASYKDEPSLANMTSKAISMLQNNENGFFLMVEAGAMDESAHESDIIETCHQIIELDKAIAEAVRFAAANPDTMIIVTADHDTGGCMTKDEAVKQIRRTQRTNPNVKSCVEFTEQLSSKYERDLTELDYRYTTIAHTNNNVSLFAYGYGTGLLNDTVTKTFAIGKFVGNAVSGTMFGAEDENGLK